MSAAPKAERSVGELFGELARDTTILIRHEASLATTELSRKAGQAAQHSAQIVVSYLLGVVSLIALLAALVAALSPFVPIWISSAGAGFVVAVAGVVINRNAVRALTQIDATPTLTFKTLKENQSWALEQVR